MKLSAQKLRKYRDGGRSYAVFVDGVAVPHLYLVVSRRWYSSRAKIGCRVGGGSGGSYVQSATVFDDTDAETASARGERADRRRVVDGHGVKDTLVKLAAHYAAGGSNTFCVDRPGWSARLALVE